MRHRALLLLPGILVACSLTLAAAPRQTAAVEPAEQVQRLRLQIDALSGELEDTENAGDAARAELVAQLRQLRRQIDELLARLATPIVEEPAEDGSPPKAPSALDPEASGTTARPVREPAVAGAACAELAPFDSNDDGILSALDRYWRYFRLWQDDGDGEIEARELRGLYDAGIRELTIALDTYRTLDGEAGDVLGSGTIRLELLGRQGGMAALTLDADRLARGGELELRDAAGSALSGTRVLTAETFVVAEGSPPRSLSCP